MTDEVWKEYIKTQQPPDPDRRAGRGLDLPYLRRWRFMKSRHLAGCGIGNARGCADDEQMIIGVGCPGSTLSRVAAVAR